MDRCIRDDVLTNKAIVYVNINVILVTEVAGTSKNTDFSGSGNVISRVLAS